ncbi:zinc ribbon domain-containing protein, partial [Thermoplasma sp.]|uniref:zinc ribbon domain-containing protein n=1 Tax=Thermoplasma sp. TaxID=1973142 RepID=UPI0012856229
MLVELEKNYTWLYEVNSQYLRMSLRFLDNAFKKTLMYKTYKYGKNVVRMGRFDPSSKICSRCGNIKHDLKLSDRAYHCDV